MNKGLRLWHVGRVGGSFSCFVDVLVLLVLFMLGVVGLVLFYGGFGDELLENKVIAFFFRRSSGLEQN